MSFALFIGLGLGAIAWGLRTTEEVVRLSAAIIGAILLIWGLCLTPQMFLIGAEILTVIAVFRICVRCCECDG
ncbi:hypothetical protein I4641_18830 [Waterburya agarophytonicola K14]|uniref:Uncharacterized protein n=1 Tax=Waterburya agarophytonicola KI4 TaxID=2874699 RepID=A0A964BWF7_9CYAN|nr:hypothetical protein [Waterburya agarophytonicola]MCC0179027.1 hypothetical protein [Waterburya agarophytonicola KI4]